MHTWSVMEFQTERKESVATFWLLFLQKWASATFFSWNIFVRANVIHINSYKYRYINIIIYLHIYTTVHDWADENGIKILKNIKDIAKPGSIVVLLEFVQGVHGNTMEQTTSWLDINMMGSCEFGAKERTMEQYQALFAAAGYKSTAKRIPLRDISSAVQIDTY